MCVLEHSLTSSLYESVSKYALDFETLSTSVLGYAQNLLQIRGDMDVAGYKPHDVCVSKLELTIVQGCTMVNDWHRMATEGCRSVAYSVNDNDEMEA